MVQDGGSFCDLAHISSFICIIQMTIDLTLEKSSKLNQWPILQYAVELFNENNIYDFT